MRVPEIHYARSGDVHVAHQTWGIGAPLVGVPPFAQNIELLWGDPTGGYQRFLQRLGTFRQVTHFDKRGTGLSDRVPGFVGLEQRVDDLRAVMDDAGIERAAVGGISEGGPLAMLFAATYPERVEALVLCGTAARFVQGDDYPHGAPAEDFDAFVDLLVAGWSTPDSLLVPAFMPSLATDAEFCEWVRTYERGCASPGSVREILQFVRSIDVRDVLAAIQAPTLVIHRSGDLITDVAHGRYLAEHIPDARFLELPGDDHVPWVGDSDAIVDAIEEFLTGSRSTRPVSDRVLATVLFSDIVGSTELASRLGDAGWHQLLDRHDRIARREVEQHGGKVVKTTGDGVLAVFDSPSRAVRAATALAPALRTVDIDVRVGVHTGEIEQRGDDIAGLAVHVAARVQAFAGAGDVFATSTVRDLVLGSPFTFTGQGVHTLKGVPGEWQLLSVNEQ